MSTIMSFIVSNVVIIFLRNSKKGHNFTPVNPSNLTACSSSLDILYFNVIYICLQLKVPTYNKILKSYSYNGIGRLMCDNSLCWVQTMQKVVYSMWAANCEKKLTTIRSWPIIRIKRILNLSNYNFDDSFPITNVVV